MDTEHEVDQCPLEPGPGTGAEAEAGPADLGSAFEIQDAQVLSDIPVGLGFKGEGRGLAPGAHHLVVGRIFSHRHARVRDIGDFEHDGRQGLVRLAHPGVDILDGLRDAAHLLPFLFQVPARFPGARDLFGELVALGLELVGLLDEPAAVVIEAQEIFKIEGRAAIMQGLLHEILILADEFYVEHEKKVASCTTSVKQDSQLPAADPVPKSLPVEAVCRSEDQVHVSSGATPVAGPADRPRGSPARGG